MNAQSRPVNFITPGRAPPGYDRPIVVCRALFAVSLWSRRQDNSCTALDEFWDVSTRLTYVPE